LDKHQQLDLMNGFVKIRPSHLWTTFDVGEIK